MQGYLLSIALSVYTTGVVYSDDPSSIDTKSPSEFKGPLQNTTAVNHYAAIELSSQLLPSSKSQHMQIDYQPFDNSFSLSANSFLNSAEESAHFSRKAYLGVGWKKMLDQARLGMSVDIGATYEESVGLNQAVSPLPAISKNRINEREAARWQPVIHFGVSYRF